MKIIVNIVYIIIIIIIIWGIESTGPDPDGDFCSNFIGTKMITRNGQTRREHTARFYRNFWRKTFDSISVSPAKKRCEAMDFCLGGNVVGGKTIEQVWYETITILSLRLARVNNNRRRVCLTTNRRGLRRFVSCVRVRHTFHAPSNDLVWKSGKKK